MPGAPPGGEQIHRGRRHVSASQRIENDCRGGQISYDIWCGPWRQKNGGKVKPPETIGRKVVAHTSRRRSSAVVRMSPKSPLGTARRSGSRSRGVGRGEIARMIEDTGRRRGSKLRDQPTVALS